MSSAQSQEGLTIELCCWLFCPHGEKEMAQECAEGSNSKEADGRASWFFLLHANHLAHGLISSIDSCIHLSHLILQNEDSDSNRRHATLHLLPSTTQSFVAKSGFEERQVILCKDSCSSCYCCPFKAWRKLRPSIVVYGITVFLHIFIIQVSGQYLRAIMSALPVIKNKSCSLV